MIMIELTAADEAFLREVGKASGPATARDFRHRLSGDEIDESSRKLADAGYLRIGQNADFGSSGGMRTGDRVKTYALTATGMAYVQFKFGEGNKQ